MFLLMVSMTFNLLNDIDMLGVVLSGGQSRRMGSDKGMLVTENKTWVRTAFDKLNVVCEKAVVSVNVDQREIYKAELALELMVADNTTLQVHGPLQGLLSVHMQYPDENLLVLACDMVAIHTKVLEELLLNLDTKPGFDVYVFGDEKSCQPVVGIYTAALLHKVLLQSRMGILDKFSLKHIIENAAACIIPVPTGWEPYFVNYNYKEDIDFQ